MTYITPESDLSVIKNHIANKLNTNEVFLKPMYKHGARYLSFGLFCRSERDDLDLRMRGLWPRGTMIYKWNSKAGDTGASNRVTSLHTRRGPGDNRGSRLNIAQRNSSDTYRLPSAEQRRLHSQHV